MAEEQLPEEQPSEEQPSEEQPTEEQPTQHLEGPPTLVEPSSPVVGRNVRIAIATGLGLAALVIGLLFIGPVAFFALAMVVILVAQAEFYHAARSAGRDPATALGLVAGAVMLVGVLERGESAAGLVLFLSVAFCFVWFMALEQTERVFNDVAVTVFGIAYIPMMGAFAGLLLSRPGDGRQVVVAMIATAAIYDIVAYAAGSRFGKTPLAPSISPKKTREGALAATLGLLVLGPVLAVALGPWNWAQGLVFAVFIAVAAPLGDLVESLIKRDFGIKDMGTLLPGHGGALDRIDAILFAAPATYFSLTIFGL